MSKRKSLLSLSLSSSRKSASQHTGTYWVVVESMKVHKEGKREVGERGRGWGRVLFHIV